jgi:hypothetical protein
MINHIDIREFGNMVLQNETFIHFLKPCYYEHKRKRPAMG